MMKFFFNLADALIQPADAAPAIHGRPIWESDPLLHPDLSGLDQRQIGDLPMVPALREHPVTGLARDACNMRLATLNSAACGV